MRSFSYACSVGDFAQRTKQGEDEEEQKEKGLFGLDQPEGRRPFDDVREFGAFNWILLVHFLFVLTISEEKEEHLKEFVEPTASSPSASPANVSNISTAAQSGDVPQEDVDEDGYSIKPKWETQTIKKGNFRKS